jgi:membrane protein implicated in regulation of membrane protease activity
MLRSGLLVFGIVLTGIGLVLLIMRGTHSGQPFLIWGAIVVIAVLCERWRYRRNEHSKGGQWQQTGERFEDPETGQNMEVFYDPASGERRYVQCDDHLLPPKK